MGTRDPDFPDAVAEARWLAAQLHADSLIVDGRGARSSCQKPCKELDIPNATWELCSCSLPFFSAQFGQKSPSFAVHQKDR
jgi:hypothetical protein